MPSKDPISYHITGYHPTRRADDDDRTEPCQIVNIPLGAEALQIAVYGDGLVDGDAVSAAFEFLRAETPDWCAPDEWERHENAAYVTRNNKRKGR